MGNKSKPAKSTTTSTSNSTSTSDPWAAAKPALEGMLTSASGAYAATPKTPIFTGPNAQQLAAQSSLQGFAQNGADAGAQAVLANAAKTAGGFYLDPANNPFMQSNPNVQGVIDAAINPLRQQLDQNVLSIGDAAKLAGAYGGDRQDLLKGQALTGFNREALDAASKIQYGAWNDQQNRLQQEMQFERTNQNNAAQLFQQGNQLAMAPAQIMAALGDQTAGWDLAAGTAARDAPWTGLDKLATLLGTVSPYGTTTTTGNSTGTTIGTPAKASGLQSGLSGALGGASAGSAFGPWGAGIGAVVGGLGGLFG